MRKIFTIIVSALLITSCSLLPNSYYKGPKSDHFNGKRFIANGEESGLDHFLFAFTLKDRWGNEKEKIEQHNFNKAVGKARITFVGHASFLVQVPDANILIDPMWSNRAGPIAMPFVSIKRQNPPAINFEDLPKIDYVLISYNSYYHMDIPTIKKLKEKFNPKFITGLGNCHYLNDVKKLDLLCVELDWNQKATPQNNLDFHFLKSQNWAKRSWIDKNKTLWGSFAIKTTNFKIYFSGDSGYSDHFAEIGNRFGGFDAALLAIGSFEPRWLMEKNHMNPEDAAKAHLALKAKKSIGFHFATFQTSNEGYLTPLFALEEAKIKYGLKKTEFIAPKFGEPIEF